MQGGDDKSSPSKTTGENDLWALGTDKGKRQIEKRLFMKGC